MELCSPAQKRDLMRQPLPEALAQPWGSAFTRWENRWMNDQDTRVARCYSSIMTRTSQPTRLPLDVYESALAASAITSRTVPQQIAHWARIGRELEMSPEVNHRAITKVLTGKSSYDSLGEREQAIVRGEWAERLTELRGELDYTVQFSAAGEAYSEADEDGNVLVHHPTRT